MNPLGAFEIDLMHFSYAKCIYFLFTLNRLHYFETYDTIDCSKSYNFRTQHFFVFFHTTFYFLDQRCFGCHSIPVDKVYKFISYTGLCITFF